jgi:hypothetical protein
MPKAQSLELAGSLAEVRLLSDVDRFSIEDRWIAINATLQPVSVVAPGASVIPSFSSRTLQSVEVENAQLLVLVQPSQSIDVRNARYTSGWCHHSEITTGTRPSGDSRIPLWRSPQLEIGTVSFVPACLPGQRDVGEVARRYKVLLSMWFAHARTDCGIHDTHDFLEIHTQVAGAGRMQKFLRREEAALFEDELMTPGYTTSVPYCQIIGGVSFQYPWHRYYADTDSLWLALEYHPEPA